MNPIFKIVDEVKVDLGLKDEQVNAIKQMHKLVLIALKKSPTVLEQQYFITNVQADVQNFADVLGVEKYMYMHTRPAHQRQDMIDFKSAGIFNCSTFEALNSVSKKILKRFCNFHRDSKNGRITCVKLLKDGC